jgi:hypothetical protein
MVMQSSTDFKFIASLNYTPHITVNRDDVHTWAPAQYEDAALLRWPTKTCLAGLRSYLVQARTARHYMIFIG